MTVYKVKLITPEGEKNIECAGDTYILDAAEEQGVDLPYSCRAGACSSCTCKLVSGSVEQSDGSFLDERKIEAGFVLSCIAYPTSNIVLETHKEDELQNQEDNSDMDTLEMIEVIANESGSNLGDSPHFDTPSPNVKAGNAGPTPNPPKLPDDQCPSSYGIDSDIIGAAIASNIEIAEQMSRNLQQRIKNAEKNFKNNKRTEQEARRIFEKAMNNPNFKIRQSDMKSIQDLIELDNLKHIEHELEITGRMLKKVGWGYDVIELYNAFSQSMEKKDWRPFFDFATSWLFGKMAGVTTIAVLSVVAAPSIPLILGSALVSAMASYYFDSDKIGELRQELEDRFNKPQIKNNNATGCNKQ